MIIKIPLRTPSVNHLYFVWQGRRIKTTEARNLEKEIVAIAEKFRGEIPYDKPLKVCCKIHEDWYYKNGMVRRVDVANREKFLIDAIFEALGIDDRFIWVEIISKVQSTREEKAIVNISVI